MNDMDRRRLAIVSAFFLAGFVVLLVRAWFLHVVLAEEHLERGGWRTVSDVRVVTPRGGIYDRRGAPLAESVESRHLVLDVRHLFGTSRDRLAAFEALVAGLDGYDSAQFREWAASPLDELTRNHTLARHLSPEAAADIQREARRIGVISLRAERVYRRIYPAGELAGNLVGFVDRDGVQGRAGVEAGMNQLLSGSEITYQVQRDRSRDPYLFEQLPDFAAARGAGVALTIDGRLQGYVENVLARTVERYNAQEAMAVVSDVRTGELLSIGTWPPFDPRTPFDHPEDRIWVSHALGHAYEPGSTCKIFTFAAALNEGLIEYDTPIDCEGGEVYIDEERVRDTHREDVIPAWKVLQVSSNIGALKMGLAMEDDVHEGYLRAFGFGSAPALGVSGTANGLLVPGPWIDIVQANMSFGHGFSASIVQVNLATATVANDGLRMRPMLVREIQHGDGRVERIEPESIAQVVRPEVARQVTQALEMVVHHEDGTGQRAAIPGQRVAGKTGTANLVDMERGGYLREYLASFTGYFPAEAPRWAITVWVLRPDTSIGFYGGEVAAPVFRRIGEEVLRLYGADDLASQAPSVGAAVQAIDPLPVRPAASADTHAIDAVPDLSGLRLREAIARLERRGLDVEVHGAGRVLAQRPAPGTVARRGERVVLELGTWRQN